MTQEPQFRKFQSVTINKPLQISDICWLKEMLEGHVMEEDDDYCMVELKDYPFTVKVDKNLLWK